MQPDIMKKSPGAGARSEKGTDKMKKSIFVIGLLALVLALSAGLYTVLYAQPSAMLTQASQLAAQGHFDDAAAIYQDMLQKRLFGALTLSDLPIGAYRKADALADENAYAKAESLLAQGRYEQASEAFAALGEYGDAASRVSEPYLVQGELLMQEGRYAEAADALEKAQDSGDAPKARAYCMARLALEQEDYALAEDWFAQAQGYADADALRAENAAAAQARRQQAARRAPYEEAGHVVLFGRYEQDGDLENGSEPIAWITLDARDGCAMLLARDVLDCQPFSGFAVVTWEESGLRTWLSRHFLTTAFSDEERAALRAAPPDADKLSRFGTHDPLAQDLVTLLDAASFAAYAGGAQALAAAPTPYAMQNGVVAQDGAARWWLRVDGYAGDDTALVDEHGERQMNVRVDEAGVGVRPVVWADIDALIALGEESE